MDTELRTPVLDFSGFGTAFIEFKDDFYWWSGGSNEFAAVDVSTNGGAGPWTNLWWWSYGDHSDTVDLNISDVAAGQSNVMIRFHYYGAWWEYWWEVDEVVAYGERDTDRDGLPDWWESRYSAGSTNMNPLEDDDEDGVLNGDEHRAGTAPNDTNSFLGIRATWRSASGTGVVVRWSSAAGQWYRLDRSSNLMSDAFTTCVDSNLEAVLPQNVYTDQTAVGSGPWLYRIKLE